MNTLIRQAQSLLKEYAWEVAVIDDLEYIADRL